MKTVSAGEGLNLHHPVDLGAYCEIQQAGAIQNFGNRPKQTGFFMELHFCHIFDFIYTNIYIYIYSEREREKLNSKYNAARVLLGLYLEASTIWKTVKICTASTRKMLGKGCPGRKATGNNQETS